MNERFPKSALPVSRVSIRIFDKQKEMVEAIEAGGLHFAYNVAMRQSGEVSPLEIIGGHVICSHGCFYLP